MGLITLPDAPRRLAEITEDGTAPTYGQIYRAGLSNLLPVTKIGSRLFIEESNLPTVASYFHLKVKKPGTSLARKSRKLGGGCA